MDMTGQAIPIHLRTDAKNLVTTATTMHLPEQKETIHMVQQLRKHSQSGDIADLAHIRTEMCLADPLTKDMKAKTLIDAVHNGQLPECDLQQPFREMMQNKHKAVLAA